MSSITKELSKVAKRKKRKTRRCLDEMRNRSLRMRGDLSAHRENPVRDERKASSLITTNRLTLNMFPKSIRSETITRPILEEIKQQSSLACQSLDKNTNRIASKNKVHCSENSNSAASNNSMPLFDLQGTPQEHHSKYLNYSLSPTTQVGRASMAASSCSTTSVSSETSDGDAHEFYEELMNQVSAHLQKLSSAVVKEDFMKDTKMNLRNLLHKTCLEKCFESCSQGALKSPEELIVQNPLSYLKLRQVHEPVKYDESGLSEPSSIAPSPAAYGSSPQFPLDSLAASTHNIALLNTPQYSYYPHKLN